MHKLVLLMVLALVALLASLAHAQTATIYGPSGMRMGYVVVTPPAAPGTIPVATPRGIPGSALNCPPPGQGVKDEYRRFLPLGFAPAPGLGICENMGKVAP